MHCMQMTSPTRGLAAAGEVMANGGLPTAPPPWSDDDQALLDILLMCEPLPASPEVDDMPVADAFDDEPPELVLKSPPEPQSSTQPASPVSPTPVSTPPVRTPPDSPSQGIPTSVSPSKTRGPAPKGKLTTLERRARHREVVKRAYHRNKAALKSLRDTVSSLEEQLEKLSLQQKRPLSAKTTPAKASTTDLERRYALLTTQQESLGQEAARLRLLLNFRQQFASRVGEMVAAPASSSDSDDSTDVVEAEPPLKKSKSSFYAQPHPTLVSPQPFERQPLAVAMRHALGYKPLSPSAAKTLVRETYAAVRSFALNGRALSSGARVLGWEDRRLLDGTRLKFSLRKRFPGRHAPKLMADTWQCLSDPVCTERKFRGLMTLHVLQRVDGDTLVALRDTKRGDVVYRSVYLLFRVRTRRGFLICTQSMDPEQVTDLRRAGITREGQAVRWAQLSGWFGFESTREDEENEQEDEDAQVEYGGWADHGDSASVASLAMNTLSIALQWENLMVGPLFSLLPSEPSL